jgi:membrane-associated phospholipid phosphatase
MAILVQAAPDTSQTKISWGREIAEWGIDAAVSAFTKFYLSNTPVWTSRPLLQTKTQGPYKSETVNDLWLYPLGAAMVGGMAFMPNSDTGFISKEYYCHAKGFIEAAFVVLPLIDEIVKHSVGKKRPNYDAGMKLYAQGQNIDTNDLRESFYSTHAAICYGMATYLSLYLFRNVSGIDESGLAWKIPVAACAAGIATYVSYTRVADNLHEPIDVVAGGVCGAIVSAGMYFVSDARVGKHKIGLEFSPRRVSVDVTY